MSAKKFGRDNTSSDASGAGAGGGMDSFAAMFEAEVAPSRRKRLRVGERVSALVVQVGRDAVFVELEGRQQAFLDALDADLGALKEGDRVDAYVVEVDEQRDVIRLGRTLGKVGNLAAIEQAKASGLPLEGKVVAVNKGGLEVDLGGGVRAFCPMSQIDTRRVDDAEVKALIGESFHFVVTDVRDGGKNVVVSRRAHLSREANENAERAMSDVRVGAVLRGSVTGVRDFGAFVDLGGVEGLIPRSEISHDRSVGAGDALKAGDVVEVQVLDVKDAAPSPNARGGGPTKKITLSLKALAADPWADFDVAVGKVFRGTVVRSTEFGRFVRLAPAIEGLLHVTELPRTDAAEEGQEVTVVVKKIDRATKKIGLALAPTGAEVGTTVVTREVNVGAVVTGTVERIETYGVFVQIDGTTGRAGRGLVPVAELGVPRGTDLRKSFPEGTRLTAKVLETAEGRIRLSVKAARDAEERADYEEARGKQRVPASLGTFADLLKGRKL